MVPNIRKKGLPRASRVRRCADYAALKARGQTVQAGPLLVAYLPRTGAIEPRLGLTISSKVGGAVVRNRVKRRVRTAFRELRETLPAVDLNVIARTGAATASARTISSVLGEAGRSISVRLRKAST